MRKGKSGKVLHRSHVNQEKSSDDVLRLIKTLTIIVLSIIIAVAAIGAIIFVYSSYLEPEPDSPWGTVNLASPLVTTRAISNESRWDAVIIITDISPGEGKLDWIDTLIQIKYADGSVALDPTTPPLDGEQLYDDGSDGTITVEVWHIDTPPMNRANTGDSIKLTGLDEGYQGATVLVFRGDERIGSTILPIDFQ
jgi:hypothetical protein